MTDDFTLSWIQAVDDVLTNGWEVEPRGQKTKEILQRTMEVNMRKPVLNIPERKLSYQFMAAEAFWILSGDDKVSTISQYNKHITQFSDDGVTFFGAYGPKIEQQLPYVIHKLLEDRDSRQAGLTIWRENPPKTKDVPCTVAIFFNIRGSKVNAHVFMRSSDVWLGVPYDVFNFSMLAHGVCCLLNEKGANVSPGTLYLTAASSHLYERNFEDARSCLSTNASIQADTPQELYTDSQKFITWIQKLRDTKPGHKLRWWEIEDGATS